ncbi:sensor histidine kinase N-terminal domain-containing protein [Undibacterium sp. Xuan67W]|uniref:sensor histidine kinase n=1 Tax=Undibacterium sp. Xuan67W TaxID=3413057 RepID=UPI003BF1AFFF
MTDDHGAELAIRPQAPEHPLHSQPPEKIQRSLFGEILDWMLAPLLLLWPMSIAITYLVAKSIANQPFDRALEDNVLVLSQQVKQVDGKIITQMTSPARDILRADDLDSIYFQVKTEHGDLIDGDKDLPTPPEEEKVATGTVQIRNETLRGIDIRVAYSYINLNKTTSNLGTQNAEKYAPNLVLIQVAETLEKRAVLANEIIKGVILPQFIILPIALALVWFALSRGLSPLAELQHRIRARRPDDLSPIDSRQVPEEITPLVRSLNEMLERLAQTIGNQKRFIADAAHQMKTPLAGMRMQSELALRQTDQEEIHRSLLQLAKSSEAATRLVNQLLTLARAENQTPATKPLEPVELTELVRSTVHDWIQTSFSYQIDLGLEQPDFPVMIFGNPLMLRELLSNLIDNAIRYTPKGMSVTVRIRVSEEQALAILEVEDNGPGIPVAEHDHVFERFYRILGSNVQGSGLGLSIVREIAQQHNAPIEIMYNPRNQDAKYPGCLFRVSFQMNPHASLPGDFS